MIEWALFKWRGILKLGAPRKPVLNRGRFCDRLKGMATLSLTDEQVLQLVKQLPPQAKKRVLADLTAERDDWWQTTARQGEDEMRRLAKERGLDWDAMSEAQREVFVDDLLHDS
jgi:hypothetical protein